LREGRARDDGAVLARVRVGLPEVRRRVPLREGRARDDGAVRARVRVGLPEVRVPCARVARATTALFELESASDFRKCAYEFRCARVARATTALFELAKVRVGLRRRDARAQAFGLEFAEVRGAPDGAVRARGGSAFPSEFRDAELTRAAPPFGSRPRTLPTRRPELFDSHTRTCRIHWPIMTRARAGSRTYDVHV
jgi:hypothetical protein